LLTGVGGLGGADRRLLALAGVAFLATACAAARAWHAALRACDVDASPGAVTARYAIGSLVASFTPAAGGEATRVALIGRPAPDNGGAFAAAGVCALVA